MLTREDNELLTRTGPGTLLGRLFRRYWIPALQSDELPETDGAPVHVEILGERLVAFRATDGTVGLLDEACAHRGASLLYARNEECGLRCIYHGWKWDTQGRCVDTPTEPPDSTFKHRVRQPSYPVREAGGVIWAYLGNRETIPPFPGFQWTALPESQRIANKVLQECNYLQALEGGVDSAHVGSLHRAFAGSGGPWSPWGVEMGAHAVRDTSPRLELQTTGYGYRYAAIRKREDGQQYIRITPFIMPWYTFVPIGPGEGDDILFHAWVPRDDYSNWAWDVHFNLDDPVNIEGDVERRGLWLDSNFRKLRNPDNKYLQDRQAMKDRNFSGIAGIMTQDHAVQESMGPLYDRSKEHLASSDRAVIQLRRFLMNCIQTFREDLDPPGLDPKLPYHRICSEVAVKPGDIAWDIACPLDPGLVSR
jgi:phthalate 4,5-dioxygenase